MKNWLQQQDSYTKFKKFAKPQYFRTSFVRDLGEQVQVDLVTMIPYKNENQGYQYILSAIEILSRYGFCVPLKRKDGKTTLEGFQIFLQQFKEHFHTEPKLVQWDMGSEFLNSDMKKFLNSKNIVEFSTNSKRKATIVERFNRTMRSKMQRMFEKQKHKIWYDKIDDLVENYNTQKHRSIDMKPSEVNEDNKWIVWGRLFGKVVQFDKPRYKVGDRVRVLDIDPRHAGKEFGKNPPKRREPFEL